MDLGLSTEEKSILEELKCAIAEVGNERSKLIPILQLIQSKLNYLPGEVITMVADHLNISPSEV